MFTKSAISAAALASKRFSGTMGLVESSLPLLIEIPVAIIEEPFVHHNYNQFICPNRQALHEQCSNATLFDRMTIPAVNILLDSKKVPLTKDALKAIKGDIEHSSQMSINDPLSKKITDYKTQALNQGEISKAFYKAGEMEGSIMHGILGKAFSAKAGLAQIVLDAAEQHTPSHEKGYYDYN